MKILSFDIGIKNLAYAIIEDGVILDIGILNVSSYTPIKCNYFTRNKRLCGLKAICYMDDKTHCKNHKKHLDKSKKLPKQKENINIIKINMIKILDKNKDFLNVDYVYVELQPALKNPMMKSIASNLQAYFLIRGVVDGSIKEVKLISARNKIKLSKEQKAGCKNKNEEYNLRKKLSIIKGEKIISKYPLIHEKYQKYDKKDDICDAILQVLN